MGSLEKEMETTEIIGTIQVLYRDYIGTITLMLKLRSELNLNLLPPMSEGYNPMVDTCQGPCHMRQRGLMRFQSSTVRTHTYRDMYAHT